MKIKQHRIQPGWSSPIPVEKLPRVDYSELLSEMSFPIIWSYDELLKAWLPASSCRNFNQLLRSGTVSSRLQLAETLGIIQHELPDVQQLKSKFLAQGFVIIPKLLSPEYCKNISALFQRCSHLHERWPDMPGISRRSVNNLPIVQLIHQATEQLVNQIVDEPIKTSYSFTAEYDAGSSLPRHTDRPQCKFNISLMLDASPHDADLRDWPIYIEHNGTSRVELSIGDAVLYSGTRDPHWREEMPVNIRSVTGTFMHYVPADFTGSLD